jgi:hypothetical protein
MNDRLNMTPGQIHLAEQRWAAAQEVLDINLKQLLENVPHITEIAGTSDTSMLFDFMWASIMKQEQVDPAAHAITVVMCAAAFTRLARASRAEDPLAQLDPDNEDKKGT